MIHFHCVCGKHLQARPDMAGQWISCPTCQQPVGIPSSPNQHRAQPLSLTDSQNGLFSYCVVPLQKESHLTPKEVPRYRVVLVQQEHFEPKEVYPLAGTAADDRAADLIFAAGSPLSVRDERRGRKKRDKGLETPFEQAMLLPLRSCGPIFCFALFLTILLGIPLVALASGDFEHTSPYGSLLLAALPVGMLAFTCAFWHSILPATLAGKADAIPWSGGDMLMLGPGLVRCLVCFLAGPAELLLIAFLFRLYGGDFLWLDWFILWELVIVAVVYWFFTLAAVAVDGRLSSANPVRVTQLVRRLGYPAAMPITVIAAVGTLVFGVWCWHIVTTLQSSGWTWFSLFFCLCCVQGWAIFLLRWLGVQCVRLRRVLSKSSSACGDDAIVLAAVAGEPRTA